MKFIALIVSVLMMLVVVSAQRNCNTICPQNFDPICGYNGDCYERFGNDCELKSKICISGKNFQLVDLNKCEEPDARLCPRNVPTIG